MKLTALGLFICGVAAQASPDTRQNEKILRALDRQVTVTQSGNSDEFFSLCHDLQIPCGEEVFRGNILVWPAFHDVTHRTESMTLRSALNSIVKVQLNYRWQILDGVLLLSPRVANQASPLEKRISKFEATTDIIGLTSAIAKAAGIKYALNLGGGNETPRELGLTGPSVKICLVKKDSSVREILNSAVLADGSATWRFTYPNRAEHWPEATLDIHAY